MKNVYLIYSGLSAAEKIIWRKLSAHEKERWWREQQTRLDGKTLARKKPTRNNKYSYNFNYSQKNVNVVNETNTVTSNNCGETTTLSAVWVPRLFADQKEREQRKLPKTHSNVRRVLCNITRTEANEIIHKETLIPLATLSQAKNVSRTVSVPTERKFECSPKCQLVAKELSLIQKNWSKARILANKRKAQAELSNQLPTSNA